MTKVGVLWSSVLILLLLVLRWVAGVEWTRLRLVLHVGLWLGCFGLLAEAMYFCRKVLRTIRNKDEDEGGTNIPSAPDLTLPYSRHMRQIHPRRRGTLR
jgi:hypothetical protein